MKTLIICIAMLSIRLFHQQTNMKEVSKNNMTVKWKIEHELILFEMEALTDGWVAIGFNETNSLTGTYLLMGRVKNGKTEVVEHYTSNPGSYKPIVQYGVASQITNISGNESGNFTRLKFAIPVKVASKYHKELMPDTEWTLLMAYSLEDDFQHHSIMRTSIDIKL
jgi:hypothetical protein